MDVSALEEDEAERLLIRLRNVREHQSFIREKQEHHQKILYRKFIEGNLKQV